MSKRANGEGTVRQRPNGLWEARLAYLDPKTGQRKRTSFYADTAKAAREKLKNARERLDKGAPPTDAKASVKEWMAHWRATTLQASDRKANTIELYERLSIHHIETGKFGTLTLDKLKPSHIEALIVHLKNAGKAQTGDDGKKNLVGLAESTVRTTYTVLRSALDTAVRDGLLAENPATKVKRPKVERKEAVHFEAADLAKILKAADSSRYHTTLLLIAASGIRRGEAAGLRWSDVELKEQDGKFTVRKTAARIGGELVLTDPKTKTSRRTIPLSQGMVTALKAHRKRQLEERLRAGDQWKDNGMVFTTEFGTIVDPRNLLRVVKAAAKKAGIEKANVHAVRHSAAMAWLESGVHIKAVADLLGHSSIAITGDIYGHTSDQAARSAVDGLSAVLGI
ncbi:tyrosine-type recombinase/integrase [Segniliparus rugosus]|uniref:Site-specific integrase n=1 Tax=Segniliparus rugosus (strain ATCC BAA-974 / DSM 45345 / CCUG 50838 / CIP 108380 / JCM 13579 / CDC 945) TaxID=679197 RepID=E5XNC9_SEGRC|nr:tyrosine-type recombinase/integrase [Segniliparus rugosus]EFV14138.1 hypothetical protein HMPREF9336_01055 [Segniliparus rugosus ATCC BAA-974]